MGGPNKSLHNLYLFLGIIVALIVIWQFIVPRSPTSTTASPDRISGNRTTLQVYITPAGSPTQLTLTLPAIWQGALNGCGGVSTCKVRLKITKLNPDYTFEGEWAADYDDGAGFSNVEWITGAINQDQITWKGTGRAVGNIVSDYSYSGIINDDGSISGHVLDGNGGTFTIYKK